MTTDWYAPNQQAVGVEPAAGPAPVKQEPAPKAPEGTGAVERSLEQAEGHRARRTAPDE